MYIIRCIYSLTQYVDFPRYCRLSIVRVLAESVESILSIIKYSTLLPETVVMNS